MMLEIDPETLLLLCLIAAFFLIVCTVKLVLFLRWFFQENQRINNEILRTKSVEKHYWIRRRRRLWLSLLPFVKYKKLGKLP